jgi:hypothetical protein
MAMRKSIQLHTRAEPSCPTLATRELPESYINCHKNVQTIQEAEMNETPVLPTPKKESNAVAVTAIIATAFVLIACIAGCSAPLIIAALHMH